MSHVSVEVMPWLSRYFAGESSGSGRSGRVVLEWDVADGDSVGDLLDRMSLANQGLGEVLFAGQTGKLSGHITLILNGRLLEIAGGLGARLRTGDTLRLLPTLAGG